MPDDLYERDILVWSERQADLLRRLAAGERVNDAVDWPNVIDEMETVGRSELHACESLVVQAMVHLLKVHAEPGSEAVPHWRAEVLTFLAGVRRRFTPSMRQKVNLQALYDEARGIAREASPNAAPSVAASPFTLPMLIADAPDLDALLAKLLPSEG